ncbi:MULTISPECIES: hypothetical protein [unclassified Saccharicrinis]|uniref:hypothetical protein n=1 Tax=unclassified Saccharicrinis TaxID=2646859 RepID=UPI003D356C75
MKKLGLILIVLCSFQGLYSQQLSVDSLQKRIETLESALQKEHYTYIPIQDFDQKLRNSVKDEIQTWVDSRRMAILTLWGILSFLLGFLLKYFFTENYRKKMEARINEETREVKERSRLFIKEITDKLSDHVNEINQKYTILTESFSHKENNIDNRIGEVRALVINMKELQDAYVTDTNKYIENKINSTLSFIWDDIVDDNIRKAKERNYVGDDLIDSLNKLLENDEIQVSDNKKIELIDCIIRCYYYKKEIKGSFGDKMISIVEKYEKSLNLKPETFANIAINACNYYEFYGTSKFREATELYCNKSINMLPDYGIAYTVLLELFMIDFKKSKNKKESEQSIENIRNTFISIGNNKSDILPLEILERAKADHLTYLKQYIDDLFVSYAADFNIIRERALQYLVKNYESTLKKEKDKLLLKYILDYGINTNNVIIDGKWELKEYSKAGIREEVTIETIEIKDFEFKVQKETSIDNGLIYFLTATDPLEVNLYFLNQFRTVKGIYKLQDDRLFLCLDLNGGRPNTFTSTSENGFVCKTYKRAVDIL